MRHPAHVSCDYPHDIDLLRRRRKRRSAQECGLTLIAVTAAVLCNCLAIGMVEGDSNIETNNVTSAVTESAEPEMLSSTTEAPGLPSPTNDAQTVVKQTVTCLSSECDLTARTIQSRMDANVDPCEDFYRFSCGGFINKTNFSPGYVTVDPMLMLNQIVEQRMKTVLESKSGPNEGESDKFVKNLYNSCMDMTIVEWDALKHISQKLYHTSWPVLDTDKVKYDKLVPAIYSSITKTAPILNLNNDTETTIHIKRPNLSLRKFFFTKFDSPFVQTQYKRMVDTAVMFGAERNRAETEFKDVIQFEIEIVKIPTLSEDPKNMTFAEFMKDFHTESREANSTDNQPSGDNKMKISFLVDAPSFSTRLNELIMKTPIKVVANYVIWTLIKEHASKLNPYQLLVNSTKRLNDKSNPMWEECLQSVYTDTIPFADAMYDRKYGRNIELRKDLKNMFEQIKLQLMTDLQQVHWMDEETRRGAVEKVRATGFWISSAYTDDGPTEKMLAQLKYWSDSVRKYVASRNGPKNVPHRRKRSIKIHYMIYARALYNSLSHGITIAPGFLASHFFTAARPRYVNYGAMGFIIGHEMNHGMDNNGRKLGKDGTKVDWWSPFVDEKYLERMQCIIDQYSNFTDEESGFKFDGVTTQNENFADIAGVRVAYRAYNKWAAANEPEAKLPGLDYTSNQMFWLSMASSRCSKYKPGAINGMTKAGFLHLSHEYRVFGSISNMQEFATDFDCPKDTRMNPSKRCRVW